MEPQETSDTKVRRTAVHALAIVGFLALVVLGIVLAIYASRYVPLAVSNFSFWGKSGNSVSLVAVSTSTPYNFETGTTTPVTTNSATTTTKKSSSGSSQPTGYQTVTSTTYTPGSVPEQVPTTYYGQANLIVSITAVGYIDDNGNFVQDDNISQNQELAAKILVTNSGTNKTGPWNIEVTVPTETDSSFNYDATEPSLEPGGILPLTMTLTRGTPSIGDDQTISVQVDTDNQVDESNENDNSASINFSVN